MPMTPDQHAELINTTLSHFRKPNWIDLSLEFPDYPSSRILNKRFVKFRGGPDIRFKVQTRNSGLARNTGIGDPDVTGIEDVTIEGVTPWTKQTVNWSYFDDELAFQSDPETIIEIIKIREHDARSSIVELNETNMWTAPTSPTDKRPMGIPFWMQKSTVTTANNGSFNGLDPAGFTAGAAGISSTDQARWRNWTFRYAQVTSEDLCKKIKLAMFNTHFRAPVAYPELKLGAMSKEIYTTYRVSEQLERLAETRNQNHGNDLARFMGTGMSDTGVVINKVPIFPVFYLENNDSTDPLYGVNWEKLSPFVARGWNMKKFGPIRNASQHAGHTVHYDTWMNYACEDRRSLWVGNLAA